MKILKTIIRFPITFPYTFIIVYTMIKKLKKDEPETFASTWFKNIPSIFRAIEYELEQYDIHFYIGGIIFWSWLIFMIVR